MANIKRRTRGDGSTSSNVRWRESGARDGREQHETLEDEQAAERFRDLVNGSRQHWPKAWGKGEGFVDEVSAEPAREAAPFATWAHHYIEHLTGVDAKARRDYARLVDRAMAPWRRMRTLTGGELVAGGGTRGTPAHGGDGGHVRDSAIVRGMPARCALTDTTNRNGAGLDESGAHSSFIGARRRRRDRHQVGAERRTGG